MSILGIANHMISDGREDVVPVAVVAKMLRQIGPYALLGELCFEQFAGCAIEQEEYDNKVMMYLNDINKVKK